MEKIRPDDIWFLGDAVGKGPESDKTCDWVRTHCNHWVAGNWDGLPAVIHGGGHAVLVGGVHLA